MSNFVFHSFFTQNFFFIIKCASPPCIPTTHDDNVFQKKTLIFFCHPPCVRFLFVAIYILLKHENKYMLYSNWVSFACTPPFFFHYTRKYIPISISKYFTKTNKFKQ